MKNNNNKNIPDLKNAKLKKDAVSSIYPRFLTYSSYLSVTEKSNTYDVSFPQASMSKNNSVSLNQLKGLLPQAKNMQQKFWKSVDIKKSYVQTYFWIGDFL